MIRLIVEQIAGTLASSPQDTAGDDVNREQAIKRSTAILMVEVARADHDFDESEFDMLLKLIEAHLKLTPEEASELAIEAGELAEDGAELHDFTHLLHQYLSDGEKEQVVSLLWQVAYADGRLDKYEDSLVLKVSDLLYVSRGRVMRLKHDAELATAS